MVKKITGSIYTSSIHGTDISFFVEDENDLIQRSHAQGRFYEPEELEIIRQYFKPGSVFADFGANIGNHSIYIGAYLRPSKILAVEPNPKAISILNANLALNCLCELVDRRGIGFGLSDKSEWARPHVPAGNLGATRMRPAAGADADSGIKLVRGDDLFEDCSIDFIKLDVEGMELRVLSGASSLISRTRPRIFVEVDDTNREHFEVWRLANDYRIETAFRRYKVNENVMLIHNSDTQ